MIDPRHLAGKHLSLVSDEWLHYIGNIPRHIVPAYSLWFEICQETRDLIEDGKLPPSLLGQVVSMEHFLKNSLRFTVSVGARGRSDLTTAITRGDLSMPHRDAGKAVWDAERAPPSVERPQIKRGLRP